ncbi:hypothetical protein SDRG_01230 [Saprolegnia diclina VS20]|uniref:PHD-type domain-containing protein n=2 Tax=Saprolegnia diclina (strain VS20) TaxID=1156394 RepID=T0R4G6_SAPDV|nr:hypothetical protein SDRG_01230 [Saprolegnia diclina VS20]EQC41255.1 hypothetical protein SDRG_01230 [Saprolegnia diclina VS20]|eukprot:XP_008604969.1 hypothetical protein SDRG_01230 [Saprolegnia diclina VS20]
MAERADGDLVAGKKRRAQDADKGAGPWPPTAVSAGPAFVPKVRLGKRYQATIPPLQSASDGAATTARARRADDDDDENDDGDIEMDPSSVSASPSIPHQVYSMAALKGDKHVDKYIKFATSLCNGYMHGTVHATTANALSYLHRHGNDPVSAACHLYAAHGFAMLPEPRATDDANAKKSQKAKIQEWMVRALTVIGHDVIDDTSVREMQELVRSCPPSEAESKELYVLKATLQRVDDWQQACVDLGGRKCTVADIQALLYTAKDLRCVLSERDVLSARVAAFEDAKSSLFKTMYDRPKGRKMVKIDLRTLKELLGHVQQYAIHFGQEDTLERIISDAEDLEAQISSLLAMEKVSVPAIRDILARVEGVPVDLQSIVEPLKSKMVSAQKWLERARKCIPPTKRQSSRNMQEAGRSKMDLSTVHDLVKNAPIDDQSSEMQEMEDLLAYADEWSSRVQSAIADANVATISVDALRELLDEGHDMPVVMEQTSHLAAIIEGREWVDEATQALAEKSSLDRLRHIIKDAQKLRKRMHPTSRELWKPSVEAEMLVCIEQADAWLSELHELLGSATCARLFAGESSRVKGPKHTVATKPSVAAVQAKLSEATSLRVDVSAYIEPLEGLLGKCAELEALCAASLDTTDGDQAFQKALAALEALDAFACYVAKTDDLRAAVVTSRDWLTRVRAICNAKQVSGRRLTKRSSTSGNDHGVSADVLMALQAQCDSLVYRFPDDEAALAAEMAASVTWQARVQDWFTDSVPSLLAACDTLRSMDTQYVAARRASWDRLQLRIAAAPSSPLQAAVSNAAEMTEENQDMEDKVDVRCDATPVPMIAHTTELPSLDSSIVVDIVRILSGTRQKESSDAATSTVDWRPIADAIETGLGYIAALETRVKDDEPEVETSDAEKDAVHIVEAAAARALELLGQSNASIATTEASMLQALVKALDWFSDARAVIQGENVHTLTKIVETGSALMASSSLPSSHLWNASLFWPLPLLETQRTDTQAWITSLESRLNSNAFPLQDVETAIAQADALQADDRVLWVELKKTKMWLLKAKKTLKPRISTSTRMPLHAASALVEDGSKLKVIATAWRHLHTHVVQASAWEERLKASGLDAGHAKVAVLVDLLHEYTTGRFLVDFDMHRDVLVSATEQYCICRQPYDGLMIGCDLCDDWFHDTCIGLSKEKAEKVEDYVCPSCGLLQELKHLLDGIDGSTKQLFELEDKAHEKAFSVAMRKVKKEERDVDKAHVAVMELQAQVTAIGQHVQYLEKMHEETPPKYLPSIALPFPQHPSPTGMQPLYKASSYAAPMLRSPYHNHASGSSMSSLPPLQPLPSIMAKTNGLPPLLVDHHSSMYHHHSHHPPHHHPPHHPPPPHHAPIQSKPMDAAPSASGTTPQEIELTRFKMEHYKLKQLAAEAEVTLEKGKERAVAARGGIETLISNRDVLLPQAQAWWRMACAHLASLVTEKEAFDLKQLRVVASMCEPYKATFTSVALMQKVLVTIPWTVEAVSLLHGHPKPAYEGLDRVLSESSHDPKALSALRGVLTRMDAWVSKTKKIVAKLVNTGKKLENAKIQVVLNEYMKLPLTCPWGARLQSFMADVAEWEASGATPVLMPTLSITPPSSPVATAPKRKAKPSSGSNPKRVKCEDDVSKRSKAKAAKAKKAESAKCGDDDAHMSDVAEAPPPPPSAP